jgi:hypothetical protein
MSIYSAQIDDPISLPLVVDNVTPVMAADVNNLRSAIIAIEMELGVKPSLQYSTVRARLDNLELGRVEIGGDIGGTSLSPLVIGIMGNPINSLVATPTRSDILIWDGAHWSDYNLFSIFAGDLQLSATHTLYGFSQTVIKLQGVPLSSSAPAFGNTIVYDGYEWAPLQAAQDYIYPPFSIQFTIDPSTTTTLYEVNQTVINPDFLGVYVGNYPTEAMTVNISEDYSPYTKDISSAPDSFNMDRSYNKNIFDGYITFTMTAIKAGITKVLDLSLYWGQNNYWGADTAGQSGSTFIEGLDGYQLALSRIQDFTVTAGATESIYYACRTDYGTPVFTIESIEGGFTYIGDYYVTNAFGFIEYYSLYESDNIGLGLTTVYVN